MKKILFFFLVFCCTTVGLRAQDYLLQEGFEGSDLPTGWTTIDNDGDGNNWYVLNNSQSSSGGFVNHSGEGHITSASYNSGVLYPDNWLITPAIELTDNAVLTFWVAGQDPAWAGEHYSVYISTTGNTVDDFTTALLYDQVATGTITQHTVYLTQYTGEIVYIAFRHHNISDMFRINLDDVEISVASTDPTIDVSPTSLTINGVVDELSTTTVSVTAINLNAGITATTSAPFAVSADGETYATTATLAQDGGTLYVQYAPTAVGLDDGEITLSSTGVEVSIPVTGHAIIYGTLPYSHGFEDEAENANWCFYHNGENQWNIGAALNTTEDGENALYVSNDEGVTNAYTVTSESTSWAYRDFYFDEYAEYTLSFNFKGVGESTSYDYLKVYIGPPAQVQNSASSSGSTLQGATLLGSLADVSTWTPVTAAIPSTASGVQRLYFLWWNDSSLGTNPPAAIDDITIVGTNCGRPTALAIDSIGSDMINFHFSPAMEDDSQWEIAVMSATDTIFQTIDDTTYAITDLNPDTYYSIKVRTICSTEELSNWSSSVSGRTSCATISAPYLENFSGFNTSPSVCWERYSGLASEVFNGGALTATTGGWGFASNYVFPLGHPRINIYGTTYKYWLVSPAISLSELSNPALMFSLALSDYNNADPIENVGNQPDDQFMVIISTDNGATWSAANATVWNNAGTGNYSYDGISNEGDDVIISLEQYAGQTIRIAFYGESTVSNGDNDLHIANVSVDEMPSCVRPLSVMATAVSAHEATITWQNVEDGSWQVAYGATGFDVNAESVELVEASENSITIQELNGNTAYDVYVRIQCEDGTYSSWSRVCSFTTLCDAFVVTDEEPYVEYFTTNSNCWTYEGLNYNSSGYLYHSLSNTTVDALTPMFDISAVTTPYLKFSERRYRYSTSYNPETLRIYYRPSVGDEWSILAEYTDNCANWRTESLPLIGASETYQVKFVLSNGYGYTYIDSVMVYNEEDPQNCLAPVGLTLGGITANSANVSWTNVLEDETLELYYKEHSDSIFTTVPASEFTDGNSYQLAELEPATSYDVYVAALCDNDDTLATNILTFTTPCVTTVVTGEEPFAENFNTLTADIGIPVCWDNSEGTVTTASYRWNYYATGETGSGLRFNSYNPSSGLWNALKTPVLDLSALTVPMVSFSYKNPAGGDFSVFLSTDGGATYTTPIATGLTGVSDWTEAEYILSELEDASSVVIVFKGTSNCGYNDAYIYLDNVFVGEAPTCPKPTELSVTASTANSVTLTWTAGNEEEAWDIIYGEVGFDMEDGEIIQNVTNPYEVTGLEPSTEYEFYVRANCEGDDHSYWSTSVTAATLCVTTVVTSEEPFTENFNTLTAGIPLCWDNSEGTVTTASYNWNYYATGETGSCVRFNSYSASSGQWNALRTPVLDLSALTTPLLSFSYKNPTGGDFSVFLSTDGGTTYTTSIATGLTGVANWTEGSYVLPAMEDASSVVVVFKGTSNWGSGNAYIDLDNVFVGEAPACPKPTSLSVTATTSESVTLSWTAGNEEESWDIIYGEAGFDLEEGETIQGVTDNPYVVTGLVGGTVYEFYVRANCGSGDVSDWTNPVTSTPGSYNMPISGTEEITSCGLVIYDDGGADESYSTNCDATLVIHPDQEGMMVHLTGTFNLETNWDKLYVYDGVGTGGTQLFYSVSDAVLDVTSTTGPLTIRFTSDGSVVYPGFEIMVSCVEGSGPGPQPVTCNAPTNVTANNITYNSAVIDWAQEGTPDSWTVNYKKASVQTWTTVNVNAHPYTITDLEAETSYDVYVAANCDTASAVSDPISFTTLIDGVNEYVNSTVIYPNPTTGQFTVSNTQCVIESVEVFDVYGKLLNTVEVNDNTTVIDVTNYASGVYFTRIHTDKGVVTKRVVKK